MKNVQHKSTVVFVFSASKMYILKRIDFCWFSQICLKIAVILSFKINSSVIGI